MSRSCGSAYAEVSHMCLPGMTSSAITINVASKYDMSSTQTCLSEHVRSLHKADSKRGTVQGSQQQYMPHLHSSLMYTHTPQLPIPKQLHP